MHPCTSCITHDINCHYKQRFTWNKYPNNRQYRSEGAWVFSVSRISQKVRGCKNTIYFKHVKITLQIGSGLVSLPPQTAKWNIFEERIRKNWNHLQIKKSFPFWYAIDLVGHGNSIMVSISVKQAIQVRARYSPFVSKRWKFTIKLLTCPTSATDRLNKGHAMRYHVYAIMHVKNP